MKRNKFIIALLAVGLSACSTITISPEGGGKLTVKPTYEESKPFYFWGLSGEHRVDVLKVCDDKEPLQMQSQLTFVDGILGLITLGIYAPHTAKVWCPTEESK